MSMVSSGDVCRRKKELKWSIRNNKLKISLPSIVCRLCNWCSSSSSLEFFRLKLFEIEWGEEELLPSIQAIVKPDIVCNLLFSGWFDREYTPRKKTWCVFVNRSRSDDNYILFFSRRGKKRREREIECFKLFHWWMLRVGQTVCCNQQTNIIISRVHIVHEKE